MCVIRYAKAVDSPEASEPTKSSEKSADTSAESNDASEEADGPQPSFTVDHNMNREMLQLYEEAKYPDVSLTVGDQTFPAHKAILTARSEYFRTLFQSGMKEAQSNQVTIEDADPAMFKELLKFLYSGIYPVNLLEISLPLLSLADRFGLGALKEACESTIARYVHIDNVARILCHAHSLSCANLVQSCLAEIKRNPSYWKKMDLRGERNWDGLEFLKKKENHELTVLVLESLTDCTCRNEKP